MKYHNWFTRLWLLGVSLALFTGCRPAIPPAPQISRNTDDLKPSTDIKVELFVDASLSMKGFVNPGPETQYCQVLWGLEDACNSSFTKHQMNYYRFGTFCQPLSRSQYRRSVSSAFYTDPEISGSTRIDCIFDTLDLCLSNSSKFLAIVVTDLFQQDTDINCITNRLRDPYLGRGLAMAVLGIRSNFQGQIYDVGPTNDVFSYYPTLHDRNHGRPFYLLLIGPHGDIENFLVALRNVLPHTVDQETFVIFSRYLSDPMADMIQAKQIRTNGFVVDKPLWPNQYPYLQHFIVHSDIKLPSFEARLPFAPLPHALKYNCEGEALRSSVEVRIWDKKSRKWIFHKDPSELLKVNLISQNSNELAFKLNFSPKLMGQSRFAYVHVELFPTLDEQSPLPDWCGDWDMNANLLPIWRSNPASFNGASTYNLYRFLYGLRSALAKVQPPQIVDLQFTIEI